MGTIADPITDIANAIGCDATINGAPVRVVFDHAYDPALSGIGGGVSARRITATCDQAMVPAQPVGAAVVVAGTAYSVAEAYPDGDDSTGAVVLVLERA